MVAIQILSDLHLEAPKAYDVFNIDPKAPYIALLGDIGCIKDQEEYFSFLLAQLAKFKFVFLVLGNHEPYHSSWPKIKSSMKQFEELVARKTDDGEQLGQFMLLDQTRFDIDDVTILGCTLFSHVPPEDVDHVSFGINDFYYIEDWDIEKHNAAHESDLKWLRGQIELLAGSEKKVIILTHYSPTRDERAVDPHHGTSRISSGFSTDLRETLIHKSVEVKLWAFGHTHFNCDFIDNGDKRIVANQRGYYFSQAAAFEEAKVVEV